MAHAPIKVITVEREYGSRGGEFARELAGRLGWRLLDEELVKSVATAAGVSPALAARYDERLDPWYYRYGKAFWHESSYPLGGIGEEHVFDSHRMLELLGKEMERQAAEGNCVIVGRGAACALNCHAGCFHIFVYATTKSKREWFVRNFPDKAQQADQMIAEFDKQRAAVIRNFYGQEWCARGIYHLLMNSAMGMESMVDAVLGAAGLRAGLGSGAASHAVDTVGECN